MSEESEKILDILDEGRVVKFKVSDDRKTINITERCDNYFRVSLTRQDFGSLIEALNEIYEGMNDE